MTTPETNIEGTQQFANDNLSTQTLEQESGTWLEETLAQGAETVTQQVEPSEQQPELSTSKEEEARKALNEVIGFVKVAQSLRKQADASFGKRRAALSPDDEGPSEDQTECSGRGSAEIREVWRGLPSLFETLVDRLSKGIPRFRLAQRGC